MTVLTGIACVLLAACSDSNLITDLNPEGPPRITMVSVLSQSLGEAATFCAQGSDIKVSTLYCPLARDDIDQPIEGERPFSAVADTAPLGWYMRIVFDELLDPSVEELRDENGDGRLEGHLDSTVPVSLNCDDTDLQYDGFYNPAGNSVSDPPGPSLVVSALEVFPAATGSQCAVTVRDSVVDKDGTAVSSDERGPFEFSIGPMLLVQTLPSPGSEGIAVDAPVVLAFNAPIDANSLGAGELLFQTDAGADIPFSTAVSPEEPSVLLIIPEAPLGENTAHTVTVLATNGLTDVRGGPLFLVEDVIVSFT
ncbi:MAG: Ig-like domain-containing protein, partial [Myxococcota bacterium]